MSGNITCNKKTINRHEQIKLPIQKLMLIINVQKSHFPQNPTKYIHTAINRIGLTALLYAFITTPSTCKYVRGHTIIYIYQHQKSLIKFMIYILETSFRFIRILMHANIHWKYNQCWGPITFIMIRNTVLNLYLRILIIDEWATWQKTTQKELLNSPWIEP